MRKVKIKSFGKTGDQKDYSLLRRLSYIQEEGGEQIQVNDKLGAVDKKEATIEAENGETILQPTDTGMLSFHVIGGKPHSKGGTPIKATDNSFIWSNTKDLTIKAKDVLEALNMRYRKKGYTPAEITKEIGKGYNEYVEIVNDPYADPIDKRSAQLALDNINKEFVNVALIQESMKGFPNGIPSFVESFMPGISDQIAAQQQNAMAEAKYGGQLRKLAPGGTVYDDGYLAGRTGTEGTGGPDKKKQNTTTPVTPKKDTIPPTQSDTIKPAITYSSSSTPIEKPKKVYVPSPRNSIYINNEKYDWIDTKTYLRHSDEYIFKNAKGDKKSFHKNELEKVYDQDVPLVKDMGDYKRPLYISSQKQDDNPKFDYRNIPNEVGLKHGSIIGIGKDYYKVEEPFVFDYMSTEQTIGRKMPASKEPAIKVKKIIPTFTDNNITNIKETNFTKILANSYIKDNIKNNKLDIVPEENILPKPKVEASKTETPTTTGGTDTDKKPAAKPVVQQKKPAVTPVKDKDIKWQKYGGEIKQYEDGGGVEEKKTEQPKLKAGILNGKLQVFKYTGKDSEGDDTWLPIFEVYQGKLKTPTGIDDSWQGNADKLNKYLFYLEQKGYDLDKITDEKSFQEAIYDNILEDSPDEILKMWEKYGQTIKGMKDDKLIGILKGKGVGVDLERNAYTFDFSNIKTPEQKKEVAALLKGSWVDGNIGVRSLGIELPKYNISETVTTAEGDVVDDTDDENNEYKGNIPKFDLQSIRPKSGWFPQDMINMYGALSYNLEDQPPSRGHVDFISPDVTYNNLARQIGIGQEQLAQFKELVSNGMPANQAAAFILGASGQQLANIANVAAQYEQANVNTANQAALNEANLYNQESQANLALDQQYQGQQAAFADARNKERNAKTLGTLRAFTQGITNKQTKDLMETVFAPQWRLNPVTYEMEYSGIPMDENQVALRLQGTGYGADEYSQMMFQGFKQAKEYAEGQGLDKKEAAEFAADYSKSLMKFTQKRT